jgi:hypothetical protein
MKTFKEYLQDQKEMENLDEGIKAWFAAKLKKMKNIAIGALKRLSLKFGGRAVIKISSGSSFSNITECVETEFFEGKKKSGDSDKPARQAYYGYLSEFATVSELVKIINENGFPVHLCQKSSISSIEASNKSAISVAEKRTADFISLNKMDNPKEKAELNRNLEAGKELAKAIFNDGIINIPDLAFCEFTVAHTGELLKKKSTADISLVINKQDDQKVVDEILASLKSYKTWKINLVNNTIVSFLNHTGLDEIIRKEKDGDALMDRIKADQDIRQNIHGLITKLINSKKTYNECKNEIIKLYSQEVWDIVQPTFQMSNEEVIKWKYHKPDRKKGEVKGTREKDWDLTLQEAFREWVKTSGITLKNAMKKAHEKHTKEVNENILNLIGFTKGADDFYLAVKEKNNMKVVSSRTSKAYKKITDSLCEEFKLIFEYVDNKNPDKISLGVKFLTPKNELIIGGEITFSKSGSLSKTKTNFMLDFSDLKDEN